MSVPGLEVLAQGATVHLTIDRGPSNSFSGEMIERLTGLLQRPEPEQRFLVIKARGENFCLGRDPEMASPVELRQVGARIAECNEAVRRSRLVTICQVDGHAAGFGVGLLAACDAVVASDRAEFWFPELDNGLPPSVVISWLARQTSRKRCFELVTSCRKFTAREAVELGVASEAVAAEEVEARVQALLELLSKRKAWALEMTKRLILQAERTPEDIAVDWTPDALTIGGLQIAADR